MTTNNGPGGYSSPKGDPDGKVTIGESDIYPERKRRLRDYLSDTTRADSNNTDVTYVGSKNKYTIDSTDSETAENTDTYREQYEDVLGKAFAIFDQNSTGASFDDVVQEGNIDTAEQADIAKNQAEDSAQQTSPNRNNLPTGNAGRWGRVGKISFPGMSANSTSANSEWKDSEEYWNKFFDGQANYYDEILERYFLDKNAFNFISIENDDFKDVQREIDPDDLLSPLEDMGDDPKAATKFTYGQHYTYAKPFLRPLLFQGLNENKPDSPAALDSPSELLTVIGDFFEVWLQAVLWANLTNLFELISYAESKVIQKLKSSGRHSYENTYYADPQSKDPSHLQKGSSGFHGDIYEALLKELFESKQGFTSALGVVDGFSPTGVLSTLVGVAEESISQIMNFPSATLRDLNIAIPKATMTNLRRADTGDGFGGATIEALNIALSYNTAAVAGMAEILASYLVGSVLDRRNTGYYETLIRSIKRNRVFYRKFLQGTLTFNDTKFALGEGNKLVRFYNMCVTIGDIAVLSNNTYGISAAENKVSLDSMGDNSSLRVAKYRRKDSRKSTFSMDTLPSLNLWTEANELLGSSMASLGNPSYFSSLTSKAGQDTSSKFIAPPDGSHRFSQQQVEEIENSLESELMPFSIQDLRTNEVIAFHGFLGSLSDSYAAEWSAQKGFGRLEAAQIYGGASRSIGLDFTMVSFNETDFAEMWYKINKLTTLVYPQWSEGTLMNSAEDPDKAFIQPFSQVPTASPLARVRVGDIFTSNYSKQNVARLFGLGNPKATKFIKIEKDNKSATEETIPDPAAKPKRGILNAAGRRKLIKFLLDRNDYETLDKFKKLTTDILVKHTDALDAGKPKESYLSVMVDAVDIKFAFGSDVEDFLALREDVYKENHDLGQSKTLKDEEYTITNSSIDSDKIKDFFDGKNNPIIRAFESTAGRGIACAITSIGFDWGLGEYSWNTDPGSKAPRMCKVTLGLTPIHDITPGLDHNGINRAPIYGVGPYMSNQKGDPHMATDEYNKHLEKIYNESELSLHPSTKSIF